MSLKAHFPRYTDFAPRIPVWCVTPGRDGCIHRFFDTSPISPSGRYLAVFQLPFENRRGEPGEAGRVVVIDLATGREETVVRINTAQPSKDSPMRVDPHPAWDRTWRYVTFNGFVNGTRKVFVADMRPPIP